MIENRIDAMKCWHAGDKNALHSVWSDGEKGNGLTRFMPTYNKPFHSCGCVTWLTAGSEAAGDLVLIQISLLFLCCYANTG